MSRVRRRRRRQAGFTLIDTLVAFLVLALGLGAVLGGIATATRSDARAKASRAALAVARMQLDIAGIAVPLVAGRDEGRAAGITWQRTMTPVMVPAKIAATGQTAAAPAPSAFWVEVVAKARDGTEARLAVLKLPTGRRS